MDRKAHVLRLMLGSLVLSLALASAAGAGHYTVTLTNGTSFETRYMPVPAEWDDSLVMINTDRGNWIALDKGEVSDVVSHAEKSGFGYQRDTTTLFLGWTPNDIVPADGEGGEGGQGAQGGQQPAVGFQGGGVDGQFLGAGAAGAAGSSFGLDQFINPPTVGEPLPGGIPADTGF